MPGHWQLRELGGAYVYANGRCFMDQLRQSNGLIVTRMRNVLFVLLAPTMLAVAAGVEPPSAGKPAVDKSVFNLFNPTPTEHLRAMDRDGPGTTESPYTVDAGHFQVEMTLLAYTHDRESFAGMTQRFEEWEIASMNLKLGLLNQLDAQLVLEPYNLLYEREGGNRVTRRGFGDTTFRLKYNFWGNDGGRTAFAATPYVKFPTSQEGRQPRSGRGPRPAAGSGTAFGLLAGMDDPIRRGAE